MRRANAASIACAMSETWMRFETWPGLAMRCSGPAQEADHGVLAGTIDAAKPQDRDRQLAARAERLPCRLGIAACAAAPGEIRNDLRALVDPGAVAVGVDAERRQIHDRDAARAARRMSSSSTASTGSPPSAGAAEISSVVGVRDGGAYVGRGGFAVEHDASRRLGRRNGAPRAPPRSSALRVVPTMRSKRWPNSVT